MRWRLTFAALAVLLLAGCPAPRSASQLGPPVGGDFVTTDATALVSTDELGLATIAATTPETTDLTTLGERDFDDGSFAIHRGFATSVLEPLPTGGDEPDPGGSATGEPGRGLPRDAVRQVMREQQGRLRGCYDRLLLGASSITTGRVSIRFHVEPSGVVREAEIASATLGDAAFHECLRGVVRELRFPATDAPTLVTYPFQFEGPVGGE
jgi:hypothetical protein